MSSDAREWWGPGQNWLQSKANAHFSAWVGTPQGKKWRKAQYGDRNKQSPPSYYGYRQPEWMDAAREALGRNDEEGFKRIKLDNL